MSDGFSEHARNTRNAMYTLCAVSLTQSSLRAVSCTDQADRDVSTLDAMPAVICDLDEPAFQGQVAFALTTLALYCIYLPGKEILILWNVKDRRQLTDPLFLQAHSWFVCKYHARCWYAEFVFLYYRMAMVACTVMLGSSERTNECLLGMACTTSGLLLFVVRVKPFDDGSTEDPEHLTGADKMQAYSLVATLTALIIALICKQSPDRSEDFDLLVDVVLAVIGIVPVVVGLVEVRLTHARTRPVSVAIEGAGKLGLTFTKGKVPLTIKSINPNGLAAQVRSYPLSLPTHTHSRPRACSLSCYVSCRQAVDAGGYPSECARTVVWLRRWSRSSQLE